MKTLADYPSLLTFAAVLVGLCAASVRTPFARADIASAEQARRAGVLSSFEGGQVTVGDLEDAIANKDPRTRAALKDPAARKQLLQDLVRYDLLVREAARRGFAQNSKVIQGVLSETIYELQRRDLQVAPESIPAADVARYFAEHHDLYERAEQRRASYIQVATAAEAKALITDLHGKGRSEFAKRARDVSTDARTRSQAGELGYQTRERKAPVRAGDDDRPSQALIDAMFALRKVGDISAVPLAIDDQFGLLMLTALVPPSARKLADVDGEIRELLAQQQFASAQKALVQQLRAEHKPEVHADLLDAITLDPWHPLDIPRGFEAAPPDPAAPAIALKPDPY